jgi:predicted RecA/RadA family phage recombinase
MATNFIQNGETITWTNGTGSAVASGDIVINDLIGVALVDIAASASGAVAARGVFELPAVNDAAINQGAKVYFDATAGKITPTATDNTLVGIAWEAKIQAGTVARVRLG